MNTIIQTIQVQILTVIVGLLLTITAQADFKRDYGSGVKEYNKGDYADAIKKLEEAIEEESKAQAQVRIYGMRYEPYIPYFYLGQARFKNGDCAGALKAWKESISQGIVNQQEQFSELQSGMTACEAAQVDVTLIAKTAGDAIGTLEASISRFAQLKNDKWLSSEWSSRWAAEMETATSSARSLKQKLSLAVDNTDEAGIKSVQTEATRAAEAIDGARGLALARADSLKENAAQRELAQRDNARESLIRAVDSGKSVRFKQGSDQMGALQKQLENLLVRGSAAADNSVTTSEEYLEIAQSISNVTRRYAAAEQDWQAQQRMAQSAAEDAAAAKAARERRIPPATLKQVAVEYFAGNYKEAVEISNPDALKEDRAKIQALLFRAAANYKLFVLSGEQNTQARQSAENDIRTIKRMNRNFSPYIAAFSPKFLELFRQTG